jgi:tetratricopeptide (TPR) repeat protein
VEFDRLSSLGEQVGAAWLLLGNIYATRVGANSAIPVLTEGIALAGRQPELVAELGFCYSQLQDDRRALHHYEEAVALGSRDPRLLVHLAEVLLRLGRGLEAHEWLHKVLQEHPNYPPARDLLQRLRQNPSYHELDHPPNDPEVEDPP